MVIISALVLMFVLFWANIFSYRHQDTKTPRKNNMYLLCLPDITIQKEGL
jgi:hypothetical protein